MGAPVLMYAEKLHPTYQVRCTEIFLCQKSFATWSLGCIRRGMIVMADGELRAQSHESNCGCGGWQAVEVQKGKGYLQGSEPRREKVFLFYRSEKAGNHLYKV